jgi:hypothetical protein
LGDPGVVYFLLRFWKAVRSEAKYIYLDVLEESGARVYGATRW